MHHHGALSNFAINWQPNITYFKMVHAHTCGNIAHHATTENKYHHEAILKQDSPNYSRKQTQQIDNWSIHAR